ncbi:MAG: acyl-CoA-binding protein [Myxococcales bacterium]|nr:acyl-CoA-binding protein [Myxococcales bacterium]MCB9670126.1 acyl-CoA-binding protein [Alphaproteobacteria bacterium]MCB9693567.1 acyl-CoA-binding protein [Alphaproteobacteria bacterium]
MSEDAFQAAADRVKSLKSSPSNAELLKLYALFKQGSVGDVQGSRPGAFKLRDRAKYDAWAEVKGTSTTDAKSQYIALVDDLVKRLG